MKFNIILLFCLCFTSGLLTATSLDYNTVDAQELLVSNVDVSAEALPLAFDNLSVSIIDDEVCYRATISVSYGVGSIEVQVEGCGATASAAWSAFRSALGVAQQ